MSKYEVFIDSDGVISDFDLLAIELLGGPISKSPKGKLWAAVERHGSFYESLPMMPFADRLLSYIREHFTKYAILTATGFTPKDAADQKRRWYADRWPDLTVHCVEKSPDKAAFAHEFAILIDDRAKSIDPWVAAGGIGILHTSVEDTIDQLRQYIMPQD